MSIDIAAIRAQISDGKHHGYVKVATADMLTMLDEIEALRNVIDQIRTRIKAHDELNGDEIDTTEAFGDICNIIDAE